MKCNICNIDFDPANLGQVFEHEHKDIALNVPVSSKRVIAHAREVYPFCSGEFAGGVHTYLQGGECPQRPCSDEHIQGYYRAEADLKDNYIFKP